LQPVDIATSVSEVDAAVYSLAVLHLRGQSREQSRDITPTDRPGCHLSPELPDDQQPFACPCASENW